MALRGLWDFWEFRVIGFKTVTVPLMCEMKTMAYRQTCKQSSAQVWRVASLICSGLLRGTDDLQNGFTPYVHVF